MTGDQQLRCSFCHKRADQVKALVRGPTPDVAICNECVDLCGEIMAEQEAGAPGDAPAA